MDRRVILFIATALFLSGCATKPTERFAGAIKRAKQAGHPLIVVGIHHGTPSVDRLEKGGYQGYGLSAGVAFITTGPSALKSVSFDFLPYSASGSALPWKIKRFTATGPLLPNKVYQFEGPEVVWPSLSTASCLTLTGITIRRTNDAITRIKSETVDQYVTSNVATRCTHITPVVGPLPSTTR